MMLCKDLCMLLLYLIESKFENAQGRQNGSSRPDQKYNINDFIKPKHTIDIKLIAIYSWCLNGCDTNSYYLYPKHKRSTKWFAKYDWLHYDVSKDTAFCHLCMRAEYKKKFIPSNQLLNSHNIIIGKK